MVSLALRNVSIKSYNLTEGYSALALRKEFKTLMIPALSLS